MSTAPNPYAPPQAPVADVTPVLSRTTRKSLLGLWLCAAYCGLGGIAQIIAFTQILKNGISLPAQMLLALYLGPMLSVLSGTALLLCASLSRWLLITLLVDRVLQPWQLLSGHTPAPTFNLHILTLALIARYAFLLHERGVLQPMNFGHFEPHSDAPAPESTPVRSLLPLWFGEIYCVLGTTSEITGGITTLQQLQADLPSLPLPGACVVAFLPAIARLSAGIALMKRVRHTPEWMLALGVITGVYPVLLAQALSLALSAIGIYHLINVAILLALAGHFLRLRRRGLLFT